MANIKSAMKRDRQAKQNRAANIAVRSRLRTARRNLFEAAEKGDKATAEAAQRAYASLLDKAAKKGVIKKNTADRSKSRAVARVAKLA